MKQKALLLGCLAAALLLVPTEAAAQDQCYDWITCEFFGSRCTVQSGPTGTWDDGPWLCNVGYCQGPECQVDPSPETIEAEKHAAGIAWESTRVDIVSIGGREFLASFVADPQHPPVEFVDAWVVVAAAQCAERLRARSVTDEAEPRSDNVISQR